jgi:alkaline phosphatase D
MRKTSNSKSLNEAPGFQNKPLQEMVAVGLTTDHSVRLWLRSRRPGKIMIHWWPEAQGNHQVWETSIVLPKGNYRDNTTSLLIPDDTDQDCTLSPLTRYGYRVFEPEGETLVGRGVFETAPDLPASTPSRFSIALFSCHQPFTRDGGVHEAAGPMLRAVRRCLIEHNTKIVFAMGDQMYSDYPPPLSLFDKDYFQLVAPPNRQNIQQCSVQEVRDLYHMRYRQFWSLPEWKALHTDFPCYPIVDDHDLVDNWGSIPAHQTDAWRAFIEGARRACFDYQASRVLPVADQLPGSFNYQATYGHSSFFVMDLRSNRRAGSNGRIFSDSQKRDLQRFLTANGQQKILFIILSVPIIHLPKLLAKLVARLPPPNEDFSDRWSSGAHIRDRDWVLKTLLQHQRGHPQQRLVLLSGDIHIGCVHRISWLETGPDLYQFISSGITHQTGRLIALGSKSLIRLNRRIETGDKTLQAKVALQKGVAGKRLNPCSGLNLGLVEIDTPGPELQPAIRFLMFNHQNDHPVCVYRSEWV